LVKKESGMISLVEVDKVEEEDDEEEDDEEDDDDDDGGFGLVSSFPSGIISHSSDGCTIGEGGTSDVDSIANSISTSLCNILLIGVDSGELNKIGVDGGVSVAGPVS
jgi:hypothetical protein